MSPRLVVPYALVILVFVSMALVLPPPTLAVASSITVNSLEDTTVNGDGVCTLREAITNANADASTSDDCVAGSGLDTVTFSVAGVISLGSRLTASDTDGLVIDGTGRDIVLDGGDSNGILGVSALASLEVRSLTLQNGRADNGGAIHASSASLTVVDSVVRSNVGTLSGGGIRAASTSLTVTGSTITGNAGVQAGGGIAIEGSSVATVSNTTISGNETRQANAQGGGVFIGTGSEATFTNVTITDNRAENGITGGRGGGLRNLDTATLQNTIIAGNTASIEGADCTGTIQSADNNLVGDTTGCDFEDGVSDLVGEDPMLEALASNGGRTQTHALLDGSPAVDAGNAATCAAAGVDGVDQRGIPRSQGAGCDIGAYEALQLSIAGLDQAEGDAGDSVFNAAVTLSRAVPAGFPDVTVDYATADGTATGASDYATVAATTLQFTAGGVASVDAAVAVSGDTEPELNETFTINLSNPVGAVIARGQATVTILDDDASIPPDPLPMVTVGGVMVEYLSRTTAMPPATRLTASGGGVDLVLSGEDLSLTVYTLPLGANLGPAQMPAHGTRRGAFIVLGDEPFAPPVSLEISLPDDGEYIVGRWDGSRWEFLHTTQGQTTATVEITQGGLYAIFSGVPNPPRPGSFEPDVFETGLTLAAWNGGTIEEMGAALIELGAQSAWITRGGRFVGYHPGRPDFVNAAFMAAFPDGAVPTGTGLLIVH